VREIFAIAARTGTLTSVLREIDERGYTTKAWTSQGGRQHPGRRFSKNALSALLNNVLYTGSVRHKGVVYPGEQEAIVDRDLWERVTGELAMRSGHTLRTKTR
jgi:site-specific DNA recombinase